MAKKPASVARILVVDDFEPFRGIVRSMLREHPEFQVIAEAADGFAAVQKAEELHPDLILLDIGLPYLNGIEAARRMRLFAPQLKILFLTQECSPEVVQEAFRLGACGYVVKADAVSELVAAVNAVLRGERFVGSRFAGHNFTGVSDAEGSHGLRGNSVFTPLKQNMEITRRHEAAFYTDDGHFLDYLTQFIGAALKAGNAAIVVATESHRGSLLQRLQERSLNIGAAIEQGRYIVLDAADTLSTYMVNGLPDPVRFVKVLGDLIVTAAEASKGEQARVAVFGEWVNLLWAQGNPEAAIQVEKLGNQLADTYDVDILCGYSLGTLQGVMDAHILQRICAEHSAVHSL
jgi:DNA-binding NarL/FixJ family response regulator